MYKKIIITSIAMMIVIILTIFINDISNNNNDIIKKDHEPNKPYEDRIIISQNKDEGNKTSDKEKIYDNQIIITGKVINKINGEPVKKYKLQVIDNLDDTNYLRTEIYNNIGKYDINVETPGNYSLKITAKDYFQKTVDIDNKQIKRNIGYIIELEPSFNISGSVIDDESGLHVSKANIAFTNIEINYKEMLSSCNNVITDKYGKFNISNLKEGVYNLFVSHEQYVHRALSVVASKNDEITIRVIKGYCIYGKIKDDYGQSARHIEISIKDDKNNKIGPWYSNDIGEYKTDLICPGKIIVIANVPLGTSTLCEFTREMRSVILTDKNIVVNFGPSDKYASWCGTFYDSNKRPVKNGIIRIWYVGSDNKEMKSVDVINKHKRIVCDDNGKFDIKKLMVGSYDINICLPGDDQISNIEANDRIIINKPGIYRQDIYMSGSDISGEVIVGESGEPYNGGNGFVYLANNDRFYSQKVNHKGQFCFKSIIPGMYDLYTQCKGYSSKEYGKILIEEDKKKENIQIVLPLNGKLKVKVKGIKDKKNEKIIMEILRLDETLAWRVGLGRFIDNNVWEVEMNHEIGEWILMIKDKKERYCKIRYSVQYNKTTDIVIDEKELIE